MAKISFSKIEEAMRAYRVINRIEIEKKRLKLTVPDFIDLSSASSK